MAPRVLLDCLRWLAVLAVLASACDDYEQLRQHALDAGHDAGASGGGAPDGGAP